MRTIRIRACNYRQKSWFAYSLEAIISLAQFPECWPLAPAHDRFAEDLRQLCYGRCYDLYCLLFIVQENPVHVIHIQRGTQQHQEESSKQHGML
jgi:hypothetical protein